MNEDFLPEISRRPSAPSGSATPSQAFSAPSSSPTEESSSKLASAGFYVFLATLILAPLAFLPTPYISIDLVKTLVIALGTLVSAILYAIAAIRERKLVLPPRSMIWTGGLICASLVISSVTGSHFAKSFFGEGFEVGTASFLLIGFLAALVSSAIAARRTDRSILMYVGIVAAFFISYVFEGLRLLFGSGFASFGIFTGPTLSLLNNWPDFGTYALTVALIAVCAAAFLPLSRRMKAFYAIVAILSGTAAYLINDRSSWALAALVFLGIAVYASCIRPRPSGGTVSSSFRRLAWIPLLAFAIAAVFAWRGAELSAPAMSRTGTAYSQTLLPWQMTLDVVSGTIKDHPLFGIGPNRFTQAFLTYKPAGINPTDAWGVEFASGFSLFSTFMVTQGLVGAALWIVFFVFLGILIARALRNLPEKPHERFIAVSSAASAAFLWATTLVSVPSHVILLYAFVMTGIFVGASAAYGRAAAALIQPAQGSRSYKLMPSLLALFIAAGAVWAVFYIKDFAAMAYFGSGVEALTVGPPSGGNPAAADADFQKALRLESQDVFWQGRAESGIAASDELISAVTQGTSASTSQAVAAQVGAILNQSLSYARDAVAYDPSNYYNYISEARVSSLAASIQMTGAYAAAVSAYENAIALNPQNPSLYLDLAQLQASDNQLDDALKTVGESLQVKNNYLDAVYLLSQIEAAQGNLKDAITAAQVAIQINPSSPLLYFQLGLLEYTNKDYADAVAPLQNAISLEKDYANAQYFLGLAYARLGENAQALTQFEDLSASNPGNQDVETILADLKAGRSPFADAAPAASSATAAGSAKNSRLPIEPKQP